MLDYLSDIERGKQESFRRFRDRHFSALLSLLTRLGIKANHVTLFSMFIFLIGAFSVVSTPLFGTLALLFSILLDGIDGSLARFQNDSSDGGALMDIVSDQLGMVLFPLLAMVHFNAEPLFAYIFGIFYILYIILLTILNRVGVRVTYAFRVRYIYYLLFVVSAFLGEDLLSGFHYVFGVFYFFAVIWLYVKLVRFYSRKNPL